MKLVSLNQTNDDIKEHDEQKKKQYEDWLKCGIKPLLFFFSKKNTILEYFFFCGWKNYYYTQKIK